MKPKNFQKLVNRAGTYIGILSLLVALLVSWKLVIVILLVYLSEAATFYREEQPELPKRSKTIKS